MSWLARSRSYKIGMLLSVWDDHASVEENLARALQQNALGKASPAGGQHAQDL
jgi:hypothetical protein